MCLFPILGLEVPLCEMKDSGWNRDDNTILNREPVLHQLVERNSEVKPGLDGREMDQ